MIRLLHAPLELEGGKPRASGDDPAAGVAVAALSA